MQMYEAKAVAWSAAANLAADEAAPTKVQVSAAISYCMGKTDKDAFLRKCAKYPLYARLVLLCDDDGTFDTDAFCAMHKTLYEEKEQSGALRTEELTIPGGSCTSPKMLRGSLKTVLGKMDTMQGAPTLSKADFAAQLCCYIRELIILSPFAYGNNVVRRAFLRNFCHAHGFSLNYAAVDKQEIAEAEAEAFATDAMQPMFSLLTKCLNYLQEETETVQSYRTRLPAARTPAATRRQTAVTRGQRRPRESEIAPHTDTELELMRQVRELQKTVAELRARIDELTAAQSPRNDENP